MSQLRDVIVVLDKDTDRSARLICEKLASAGVAAMRNPDDQEASSAGRPSADRVLERMIDTAGMIMAQGKPRSLWIEGGRTASSLIRACRWEKLQVDAVYADGVVGLQAHAADAPAIVVKPGSYPWPVTGRHAEGIVEVVGRA